MMKLEVCACDSISEGSHHAEFKDTEERLFVSSLKIIPVIMERHEDV